MAHSDGSLRSTKFGRYRRHSGRATSVAGIPSMTRTELDRASSKSLTAGRAPQGATVNKIWPSLMVSFAVFLIGATAYESVAQTSTAKPKTETRLIPLGTVAGPPPRPHRAQFSNLLIVNGTLYVIDAGDGVARRIAKAGFNVRDGGLVFITHHHDDHTAGLGTLTSAAWANQRPKPVHVYGQPRPEDLVKL